MDRFEVWFDLASDDLLAIDASVMTEALRLQLALEGVTPRQVLAKDRREAVRQAFPDRFAVPMPTSARGLKH